MQIYIIPLPSFITVTIKYTIIFLQNLSKEYCMSSPHFLWVICTLKFIFLSAYCKHIHIDNTVFAKNIANTQIVHWKWMKCLFVHFWLKKGHRSVFSTCDDSALNYICNCIWVYSWNDAIWSVLVTRNEDFCIIWGILWGKTLKTALIQCSTNKISCVNILYCMHIKNTSHCSEV